RGSEAAPSPEPRIQRVLLVGFMGSGKTSVGSALANRLAWAFRDFDEEISFRAGLPIKEIFHQRGEGYFRDLEKLVGEELLLEEQVVLGSGGGWPVAEGRMQNLPPRTLSVWLKVSPGEAVRRAGREGETRPLLAGPDPEKLASDLLEQRVSFYSLAHVSLDTEGAEPERLAEQIEELMKATGRA
ncbi:MAG: shikimate kinase, partial [Gemmatimonadetes bacterium]|nr:shikimate kinase [Gemmatimonadota bacterium]